MTGSFPREEHETTPDERLDIPDRLDVVGIRLTAALDALGTDG